MAENGVLTADPPCSYNCSSPWAVLHHWPPVPALHLSGGPFESNVGGGNPSLPIQITLHMGQVSDVASDRERTNPGPKPHRPDQCRLHPVVSSSLWKITCIPQLYPWTHAALIYRPCLHISEGEKWCTSRFTSWTRVLSSSEKNWGHLIDIRWKIFGAKVKLTNYLV